jgi:hypothetical protein
VHECYYENPDPSVSPHRRARCPSAPQAEQMSLCSSKGFRAPISYADTKRNRRDCPDSGPYATLSMSKSEGTW